MIPLGSSTTSALRRSRLLFLLGDVAAEYRQQPVRQNQSDVVR